MAEALDRFADQQAGGDLGDTRKYTIEVSNDLVHNSAGSPSAVLAPGLPRSNGSISRNADCFPWVMRAPSVTQRHRSDCNIGWRPALVP
jgi:hypothetical protein